MGPAMETWRLGDEILVQRINIRKEGMQRVRGAVLGARGANLMLSQQTTGVKVDLRVDGNALELVFVGGPNAEAFVHALELGRGLLAGFSEPQRAGLPRVVAERA